MQRMSRIGATRHTLPLPSRTFSMRPAAKSEMSALFTRSFWGNQEQRRADGGVGDFRKKNMLTAAGDASAIRLGGRQ